MAVFFLPKSRMKKFMARVDLTEDVMVIDLTSKGPEPWNVLSTSFDHGGIPVPGMPGTHARTVDGIWEGLKRFQHEAENVELFESDKPKKRPTSKDAGMLVGYAYGSELIRDEVQARVKILVPAYTWMVRHCEEARARFDELVALSETHTLHLYDGHENGKLGEAKPFACAALLTEMIKEARKERAAALV